MSIGSKVTNALGLGFSARCEDVAMPFRASLNSYSGYARLCISLIEGVARKDKVLLRKGKATSSQQAAKPFVL